MTTNNSAEFTNPSGGASVNDLLATALHPFVTPPVKCQGDTPLARLFIQKSNPNFSENWAIDGSTVKLPYDPSDWSEVVRGLVFENKATGRERYLLLYLTGDEVNAKGFPLYEIAGMAEYPDEDALMTAVRVIRGAVRAVHQEIALQVAQTLDDFDFAPTPEDVYGTAADVEAEEALDELAELMGS